MKLQQGDVLLKQVETYNVDFKDSKKLDHLILAEGEVTGHHHRIAEGLAELIALSGSNEGKMILNVLSDYALLQHEEHKEIKVPLGTWEVSIVREFDHFSEEARRVRD